MIRRTLGYVALVALLMALSTAAASAQHEPRIAFVVGNGGYTKAPLSRPLNDAGLIAEALRTVGFDVVEGADLTRADFMRGFGAFVARLDAAGPAATAFVYFSGYGFAYDGDNFLAGIDARLDGERDIARDAVRLSDLLRALDASPARAKIIAIDAARRLPFGIARLDLAPGLAALEPPCGTLVAYSAEPGTLIEDGRGPYGPYARALAEMIRVPGLNIVDAFPRMRVRTHQLTEGRQLPWDSSMLGAPLVLVPPDPAAPPSETPAQLRRLRPLSELDPAEAYGLAIEIDDLPTYVEYLETFPASPYALRVWAAVRARREALAWMRAVGINSPQAYWTYLRRYPDGIYAGDAARRLHRLAAPLAPPASFRPLDFVGVPPPLAQEPPIIPYFRSPPPPPARLIEPPSAPFAALAPPRRVGARALPMAAPLPALPGIKPGRRVSVASASPAAGGPPAVAPTSAAAFPRRRSRSGAVGPRALVPASSRTPVASRGGPAAPAVTSALAGGQPRVFQPSRRQGDPPPGTFGIPPTTRTTPLAPSRRRGQPTPAPAGGRSATFIHSRRQGGPAASGATPTIGRPAAPQVSGPKPPASPTVNRPAQPHPASRPSAPTIARAAARSQQARPSAPTRTCTDVNGRQACR